MGIDLDIGMRQSPILYCELLDQNQHFRLPNMLAL